MLMRSFIEYKIISKSSGTIDFLFHYRASCSDANYYLIQIIVTHYQRDHNFSKIHRELHKISSSTQVWRQVDNSTLFMMTYIEPEKLDQLFLSSRLLNDTNVQVHVTTLLKIEQSGPRTEPCGTAFRSSSHVITNNNEWSSTTQTKLDANKRRYYYFWLTFRVHSRLNSLTDLFYNWLSSSSLGLDLHSIEAWKTIGANEIFSVIYSQHPTAIDIMSMSQIKFNNVIIDVECVPIQKVEYQNHIEECKYSKCSSRLDILSVKRIGSFRR